MKTLTVIQGFENDVNHFEYDEDNLDFGSIASGVLNATGSATQKVASGATGGAIPASSVPTWQTAISGLFGGHEDKSATGFNNYIAANKPLPFYPTKDEMIKASQTGGWESVEPPAIQASYDPASGTWKRGDWRFLVLSTNPITAKAFKGASESGLLKSNVNAQIPTTPLVMAATQQLGQSLTSGATQSNPASTPVFNTPQTPGSQPLITPAQTSQQSPTVTGTPNTPQQPAFSGAANAGALLGSMSPTTLGLIVLGAVVVVGILIYMANK